VSNFVRSHFAISFPCNDKNIPGALTPATLCGACATRRGKELKGLIRAEHAHNACHPGTFSKNINTFFSTVFRALIGGVKTREGE
jgi:hypothetical protein